MDADVADQDIAVCPYCGGVVVLRRRRVMGNQHVAYWRHRDNCDLSCPGRSGRVISEAGKKETRCLTQTAKDSR